MNVSIVLPEQNPESRNTGVACRNAEIANGGTIALPPPELNYPAGAQIATWLGLCCFLGCPLPLVANTQAYNLFLFV